MKKRSLHIVLLISILAVLMACNKEPVPGKGGRIVWSVATDAPATKVYPSGTSPYSTSNTFGCYAFLYTGTSESDWASASYTTYINGLQIRYFGIGSGMWSTLSEYYWPTATNSRLHFASFSPYSTLHNKAVYGGQADGIIIPDYVVPVNKEDQHYLTVSGEGALYDDDLMVSNESDVDCAYYSDPAHNLGPLYEFEGVPTLFTHIMTKLNIQFIQNDDFTVDYYDDQTISIRKVRLLNIYSKGSFKALPTNTWGSLGSSTDAILYDSKVGTDPIPKTSGSASPMSIVSNYIALPQTISSGVQQIEVTYRITSTLSGYIFTEDAVETAYLYVAGKNWESNTDLTYTVTLFAVQEKPIEFTATAQNWVDNMSGLSEVPGQNYHLTPED